MSIVDICFSENQEGTTAVLSAWLKQPGDKVAAHEPIAEVETDKVVVEVSSPGDGKMGGISKQPGDALEPGDVIGFIDTDLTTPVTETITPEKLQPSPIATNGSRQRLSPAVRRLLKQHQLDFTAISGSGRLGRITVKDVKAFMGDAQPLPGSQRIAVDPMRKSIAAHMVQSLLQTAPHVTTVFEADLTKILNHRKIHKQEFKTRGVNLTLSAYFVSAVVHAIKKVPIVNSRFCDEYIEIFNDINIGIATALDDKGLVVPVLQQAQSKDLFGIAAQLQTITNKARQRQITAADMQGGTFTISNHGVSGSLMASPIIINQPQSAILGIGKLEKRVVVREVDGADAMLIRPMCFITLTLDHRVLDAYQANLFLNEMVSNLESWPTSSG